MNESENDQSFGESPDLAEKIEKININTNRPHSLFPSNAPINVFDNKNYEKYKSNFSKQNLVINIPSISLSSLKSPRSRLTKRLSIKKIQNKTSSIMSINKRMGICIQSPSKTDEVTKKGLYGVLVNFYLAKKFIGILRSFTSFRTPKYLNKFQFNAINDKCFDYENYKLNNDIKISKFSNLLKQINNLFKDFALFWTTHIGYFDPSKLFTVILNMFVLISMIFYFIYIPVIICFKENHIKNEFIIVKIRILSLIILILDIFKSMNTAYYRKGKLVLKRKKMIINYIKNHLIRDLFSIGPLLILEFNMMDNLDYLYFTLLLFFLKMKNFKEIFHKLEEIILIDQDFNNFLSLIKLIFRIILLSHIFACFWYYIGTINYENTSWLMEQNIEKKSLLTKYLHSYYYVCITMNTVGYGDITPQNSLERLFSIIFIYVACGLFAYSINSIGTILNDINKRDKEFLKEINILNDFMKEKKINFDLRMRVRKYIEYIWTEEKIEKVQEQSVIIEKLSDSLKEELLIEANGSIIRDIKFLSLNFSEETLRKTVAMLKEIRYTPGDIIFMDSPDVFKNDLYIVRKGAVELFLINDSAPNGCTQLKTVKQGDFFGEMSFFTGNPRKTCARSIDFTTIFCIDQEEFLKILKKNNKDFEKYYQIKDTINLYNDYSDLYMKCNSCQSNEHLVIDCPLLHYTPPHQVIILKYLFSNEQERNLSFIRKRKKNKNSLSKRKNIEELAFQIQYEYFPYQFEEESDSEENNETTQSINTIESNKDLVIVPKQCYRRQNKSLTSPKLKHISFKDKENEKIHNEDQKNNYEKSSSNISESNQNNEETDNVSSFKEMKESLLSKSNTNRKNTIRNNSIIKQKLLDIVKTFTIESDQNNNNINIPEKTIVEIDSIKNYQQYFQHNNASLILDTIESNRLEKFLKKLKRNRFSLISGILHTKEEMEHELKRINNTMVKTQDGNKDKFLKRMFFKNTTTNNKMENNKKFDREKFKKYYIKRYMKGKRKNRIFFLIKIMFTKCVRLFRKKNVL